MYNSEDRTVGFKTNVKKTFCDVKDGVKNLRILAECRVFK